MTARAPRQGDENHRDAVETVVGPTDVFFLQVEAPVGVVSVLCGMKRQERVHIATNVYPKTGFRVHIRKDVGAKTSFHTYDTDSTVSIFAMTSARLMKSSINAVLI